MIVLLLLTQNERELLRANVEHHLSWGIDHVCVADNNSTDGTPEMLREFGDAVSTTRFTDFMKRQDVRVQMLDDVRRQHGEVDWVGVSDSDEFWWAPGTNMRDVLADVPADKIGVNFEQKLYLPTALDASDGPVHVSRIYRSSGNDSPLHTSYFQGKSWYRGSWVRELSHEHWCREVGHPRWGPPEPMVHHYMIQDEDQFVQKVTRLRSWQSIRRQRIERALDVFRRVGGRPSPPPVERSFKADWWMVYQRGGIDGLRDYYRNTYTVAADAVAAHIAAGDLVEDPGFADVAASALGLPPRLRLRL
ncbi:MAG: glycosyltransferase family 2 protein [Actinomycetia bacterium]|nr:glycosyltransferase family 2 protein [Actinomycetes bacterium]